MVTGSAFVKALGGYTSLCRAGLHMSECVICSRVYVIGAPDGAQRWQALAPGHWYLHMEQIHLYGICTMRILQTLPLAYVCVYVDMYPIYCMSMNVHLCVCVCCICMSG